MIFKILLTSFFVSIGASAESSITIDEIEFSGVSIFDSPAIESTLELAPGDFFERRRLVRSVEGIQAMYASKGYPEAGIKTELRQEVKNNKKISVLKFFIKEGRPRRVGAADIAFDDTQAYQRLNWEKLSKQIKDRLALNKSEIITDDKLNNAKKMITDILASEEYIGAKVISTRMSSREADPDFDLPSLDWVDIQFIVSLGEKISFGFQGNEILTRSQLVELVEQQRVVGFGREFSESIRQRIIEEYKLNGYPLTEVEIYSFQRLKREERHFTFKIKEGKKIRFNEIEFDGNIAFKKEELSVHFLSGASSLLQSGVYVEKEIDAAAGRLIEWLRSKGYLSSKLIAVNKNIIEKSKISKIVVYLYEGDQTVTGRINIKGNSVFTTKEIENWLGNFEGSPINLFKLSQGLEKLDLEYKSRGHLDIAISNSGSDKLVIYSQENRIASIEININEGVQYKVSKLEIDGLTKTRDFVVTREIRLSPGDVVEEPLLLESEGRLRKLGVFSSAIVKWIDDPAWPDKKIIKILVKEGTPGVIAGGIGYRNDLGVRVFAQSGYSNLWHRNHGIFLNASANRRFDQEFCVNGLKSSESSDSCFVEYQTQLGYTWPWFIAGETTFRPKFNFDQTQFRSFDAKTVGMTLSLDRRLIKDPNIFGSFSYSLERIRQFNAIIDIDNQTLKIGSITPSLRIDLRDNPLAPTKGVFGQLSFEWADPAFLSQSEPLPVAYSRALARLDGHIPLTKNIGFYLSFRTGLARNLVSPNGTDDKKRAIPLVKHFALGGAGSLRGFKEQELNVYDIAIRGTLSYVNYRTQLDLPLTGALRFGPFLDAANLLVDRYSFGMLRYGSGFGFHYLSPVGPVNFDWGFKLSPKPGEDPNQFYFSIGVI